MKILYTSYNIHTSIQKLYTSYNVHTPTYKLLGFSKNTIDPSRILVTLQENIINPSIKYY